MYGYTTQHENGHLERRETSIDLGERPMHLLSPSRLRGVTTACGGTIALTSCSLFCSC